LETNFLLVEDMRYLAPNDYFLSFYMPCHSSSRPRCLILNRGSGSTQIHPAVQASSS